MPVNIYSKDDPHDRLAWLCEKDWKLPTQVCALEQWLKEKKAGIKSGRYIADIGFCVSEEAAGGGAVVSPEMMRAMADLGMSLYLSEYRDEDEV